MALGWERHLQVFRWVCSWQCRHSPRWGPPCCLPFLGCQVPPVQAVSARTHSGAPVLRPGPGARTEGTDGSPRASLPWPPPSLSSCPPPLPLLFFFSPHCLSLCSIYSSVFISLLVYLVLFSSRLSHSLIFSPFITLNLLLFLFLLVSLIFLVLSFSDFSLSLCLQCP